MTKWRDRFDNLAKYPAAPGGREAHNLEGVVRIHAGYFIEFHCGNGRLVGVGDYNGGLDNMRISLTRSCFSHAK